VLSDSAARHPESSLEREALEGTRLSLQHEVARLTKHPDAAADGKAGAKLWRLIQQTRSSHEVLLSAAYFGRLVFRDAATGAETDIYIAQHAFDKGPVSVVDWRAPVGALFYAGIARRLNYQVRHGSTLDVHLDLKRRFDVSGCKLETIMDDVDYRGSDPSRMKAIREAARKRALVNLADDLGATRELQLKEIITTIQAEQDALIRAPLDRIIAVSGVAGSGKTSVAYHRLSFLAYHGVDPSKMLFLAPNHLFLAYARSIVPELGLGQMIHRTFTDWALSEVYVADGRLASKEARRQRDGHTYTLDSSIATRMDRARSDETSLDELRS
jgi:DNA helicase-2/ATP-dependent DNA helicase PcrA